MTKYFSETEFVESEVSHAPKSHHGFHNIAREPAQEPKTPVQMIKTVRGLTSRNTVRVPTVENDSERMLIALYRADHH